MVFGAYAFPVRKFATTGSLVVVLCAVTTVPGATAERWAAERRAAEPPPACAPLVAQVAETMKKVIEPLTATPPVPGNAAPPLGDVLRQLAAMTVAKCLPMPPASPPASAEPRFQGPWLQGPWFQAPELCLSNAMLVAGGVFNVLGKVVPGAVPPNNDKLLAEVSALLKTMNDALQNCGLPAPPGGLPTVPKPPA